MSLRQRLADVIDRTTSVPVVVWWRVPSDYAMKAEFRMAAFPGLLQCHVGWGAGDATLVTYWRSNGHFRTQRAAFVEANELRDAEWWAGDLADVRVSRRSVWPTSPLDALQKAAALIGAFAVCYQAYAVLWTSPDVSVSVENAQPVNVAANAAFDFTLAFTNHSTSSAARVELGAVTANRADFTFPDGERFFTVDPGKRHQVALKGNAGRAGDARLSITSTARSGRWRRGASKVTTVDVEVWPPVRLGAFSASPDCGTTQCFARAELRVGRRSNSQLQCWARLVGFPGVEFRVVRNAIDGGSADAAGEGAERVAKIEWRQSPSEAFQRHDVTIALVADRTMSNWPELASKIEGFCDEVAPH